MHSAVRQAAHSNADLRSTIHPGCAPRVLVGSHFRPRTLNIDLSRFGPQAARVSVTSTLPAVPPHVDHQPLATAYCYQLARRRPCFALRPSFTPPSPSATHRSSLLPGTSLGPQAVTVATSRPFFDSFTHPPTTPPPISHHSLQHPRLLAIVPHAHFLHQLSRLFTSVRPQDAAPM